MFCPNCGSEDVTSYSCGGAFKVKCHECGDYTSVKNSEKITMNDLREYLLERRESNWGNWGICDVCDTAMAMLDMIQGENS